MPHSKHFSAFVAPCEKPRPKPPPYVPPPPPIGPPPTLTKSWFNLIDPFMGDLDFCRLGMSLAQARDCYQVLCADNFNMSGNLWHYDCSTHIITADVYNGWPACDIANTWFPAWPEEEDCSACPFPDPPCP